MRAKSDALCFDTFTKNFSNRACTQARTHAILTVSGADSIQLMASAYSIPTTAEVDRADDGTIVFNSWNDLTDPTKPPRAPVASATTAPSAPVTLDDWENCYQKRKCEWEVGCVTEDPFASVQDCMASADAVTGGELAADRRARKRAVEQGRASINVAAFTQCLIRTSATHCDTALYDPACLTRFTGTIADNEGCFTSVDCASPDAATRWRSRARSARRRPRRTTRSISTSTARSGSSTTRSC